MAFKLGELCVLRCIYEDFFCLDVNEGDCAMKEYEQGHREFEGRAKYFILECFNVEEGDQFVF